MHNSIKLAKMTDIYPQLIQTITLVNNDAQVNNFVVLFYRLFVWLVRTTYVDHRHVGQ